ncbi:19110_t:CDS:2 [Gigaspora rosea]|nr:19110_t:CDS:2 [Gigaspora rosea]
MAAIASARGTGSTAAGGGSGNFIGSGSLRRSTGNAFGIASARGTGGTAVGGGSGNFNGSGRIRRGMVNAGLTATRAKAITKKKLGEILRIIVEINEIRELLSKLKEI